MWKVAEFGKLIGVSASTLRRWETEGKLIPERTLGNQRIYTEAHRDRARNLKTGKFPTRIIIYCRVSSPNQKDDLASQVTSMDKFCVANGVIVTDRIEEIGGGLNFKRKKFLQMIQWAIQGEVKAIYGVVVYPTSRKRNPRRKEIHSLFTRHLGSIQTKENLLYHSPIELLLTQAKKFDYLDQKPIDSKKPLILPVVLKHLRFQDVQIDGLFRSFWMLRRFLQLATQFKRLPSI